MAKQVLGFSLVLALFASYGAMLVASAEEQLTEKQMEGQPMDPWYHQKLPPQPRPGYNVFLGRCLKKLTRQCGTQMSGYVFKGSKINDDCCCKLEKMGKLCNKAISWTLSHIDRFKPQESLIVSKSDKAFDTCSSRCKK